MLWDDRRFDQRSLYFKGAKALTASLDAAAAVKVEAEQTRIPATGHGFLVDSSIYISGTLNYDGLWKILAVTTDTFDIGAVFIAETFAGTETAGCVLSPNLDDFEFLEMRLHLSGAAAAENLTLSLVSAMGAEFDVVFKTQAMSGLTDLVVQPAWINKFAAEDKLVFTWANGSAVTFGLEVIYRQQLP
jgi:hypothetical protein